MKISEVKAKIQAEIDREQINIDVHDHLVKILTKFEGKAVSKRIATAVQNDLPKGFIRASMHYIASMTYVRLYSDSCKYEDRIDFFLCYDSDKTFRIGNPNSGFQYYNTCNGQAARERNEKRIALLNNCIKIAGYVNSYHEAKAKMEEAHANLKEMLHYTIDIDITKAFDMYEAPKR